MKKISLDQAKSLFGLTEQAIDRVEQLGEATPWYPGDPRFEWSTGLSPSGQGGAAKSVHRGTRTVYGTGGREVYARSKYHTRGGEYTENETFFTPEEESLVEEVIAIQSAISAARSELRDWKNGWMEDDKAALQEVATATLPKLAQGSLRELFLFLARATDGEIEGHCSLKNDLLAWARDDAWGRIAKQLASRG